jgi:phage tail-like protein
MCSYSIGTGGTAMTDEGSAQSETIWPLTKFHFRVEWEGTVLHFQEISGLDVETEVLDYRAGNKAFSTVRMLGLKKYGNITMKKGVFVKNNAFFDWFSEIRMNTLTRKTLTISLLDEGGKPTMIWTVRNAFPVKVSGTDLKAEGNDVAVESIEMAHEGIEIANA